MKQNTWPALALITLSTLAFSTSSAWARPHWGNHGAMWQQGISQLTTEQQTAVQKIHNDYYAQTRALRQQLMSKRYEYQALLTASTPDSAKITAIAKEMTSLNQALDEQRLKRDIALAQSGIPHGMGMGQGCGGHRGGYMAGGMGGGPGGSGPGGMGD